MAGASIAESGAAGGLPPGAVKVAWRPLYTRPAPGRRLLYSNARIISP